MTEQIGYNCGQNVTALVTSSRSRSAVGGRVTVPTFKPIPTFDAHAQDRFWEFAGSPSAVTYPSNPLDAPCWPWKGSRWRDGYGQFRGLAAHRCAYTFAIGPIPDGLTIDHCCGNRACVNPAHLEAITLAENIRRRKVAPAIQYPARKRTAARFGRRRERGMCVQCNTPSTKYRCDRCREIHNAKDKRRKR